MSVNILNLKADKTDIFVTLVSSVQKDCYKDVMIVCEDDTVWGPKVILALTFPLMAEILREREEEKELVLLLPDFTVKEVNTRIEQFLYGFVKEGSLETQEINNVVNQRYDLALALGVSSRDTYN